MKEVAEREKRKSNIIIYGCKEDNIKLTKDQLKPDTDAIPKILSALDVNDQPRIIKLE